MEVCLYEQKLDHDKQTGILKEVKVHYLKHINLHGNYFFSFDFPMGHFIYHSAYFERNDFFLFACKQHRGYPQQVNLFHIYTTRGLGKIEIHYIQRNKECISIAVEGWKHLYHPVDHPSPYVRSYLMIAEESGSKVVLRL